MEFSIKGLVDGNESLNVPLRIFYDWKLPKNAFETT